MLFWNYILKFIPQEFTFGVPCVRRKGVAIGVMEIHQYTSHNHKSLSRMVTPRRPDCDRKVGFIMVGTFITA